MKFFKKDILSIHMGPKKSNHQQLLILAYVKKNSKQSPCSKKQKTIETRGQK
jgi:hypothetical protein